MRRRRLSRYIKPTALYMGELTTNDCYASAYYLYRISEMLSGCEEMFEYQVKLFLKLASRMKCTQAISDYLEKMVEKAEKGGKFTRLLFPDDVSTKSLIYFDFSTIPFVYEEDKDIDRNIPGDFDDHEKINQTIVNLYRCLYVDAEILPQLIANFLLKSPCKSTEKIQNGGSKITRLPAKVKNAIEDFSRLDFLSNAIELTDKEKTYLHSCPINQPNNQKAIKRFYPAKVLEGTFRKSGRTICLNPCA